MDLDQGMKTNRLLVCVIVLLAFSEMQAATIYARSDGDWDQTSRWSLVGVGGASCSCVPGVGDDAVIDGYNIDIDNGTGDVTVNSITLTSNSRDDDSRLRVQNGRVLTITTDLTIYGNRNNRDQTLLMPNNNSQIIISGDLIIDQDIGDDVLIDIERTASIQVLNDLSIDKDGGDDIRITLNEDNGNAASLDITGDFILVGDNINDDLIEILLDDNSSNFTVGNDFTATINSGNSDSFMHFNIDNGLMDIANDMTLTRAGSFGYFYIDMDGGALNANSFTFNSSGAAAANSSLYYYIDGAATSTITNDVNINMTGGGDTDIAVNWNTGSSAILDIGGDLDVQKSGGLILYLYSCESDSELNVGLDMIINSSGGDDFEIVTYNDALIQIDGNVDISSSEGGDGLIYIYSGSTSTLEIGGDMTVDYSGGDDDFYMWSDEGWMNVGGDLDLTIRASADDIRIELEGGNIQVDGDFNGTLSGADEIQIDIDDNSTLNVSGNMELDLSGGDDIELHLGQNSAGSTAQLNITGNLTFDHNGSLGGDDIQFLINDDNEVNIGGDLTMDIDGSASSGNFYLRTFDDALLDVDGDFNMYNSVGSDYLEVTLNDQSKLELEGNFVRRAAPNNYGVFNSRDQSTLEFNGAIAQTIPAKDGAGTDFFRYNHVIINNTYATSPQLTVEGFANINESITYIDGVVSSTSTNYLNLANNATVSGASNASHNDGLIQKTGDDAFIFPVGNNGFYLPIEISAPSSVAKIFTAEYFDADPDPLYSNMSLGPGIDHISVTDHWEMTQRPGSENVTVKLAWNSTSAVTDLSSIGVVGWDGTTWQSHGNGGTTGTVSAGDVVSVGTVATFNAFTLASTNTNNPLPIELLYFSAKLNGERVELDWVTTAEINNDFFTLERSKDGVHFEELETMEGAGNSNTHINYFTLDEDPIIGTSFYRLKQTDFNGEFSYSDIQRIYSAGNSDISIYPNPFLETITVVNNGDKEIFENRLFNAIGEVIGIYINSNTIDTSDIVPGLYFLKSYDANGRIINASKLVKQ